MNNQNLKLQLKNIPQDIGIYQFFDVNDKIIYVGKAKNLKKRVLQYFQTDFLNSKIKLMVTQIHYLKIIVLGSEFDALLLENNFIKQFKPKYNILLKDDKNFPWIIIKNEKFPRVMYSRKKNNDKSEYFGPYKDIKTLRILFNLIRSIYPIRSCNLDLNIEAIQKKKFKMCLEYHINNCKAPCENLQTEKEYLDQIQEIRELLKGNFFIIRNNLEKQMITYSNKCEFEKAQKIKEKLIAIDKYQAKSIIVHSKLVDLDVFSIISDNVLAFVNYIKINHGSIVQSFTRTYKKKLDESNEEILIQSILDIRNLLNSNTKNIITSIKLDFKIPNVKIVVPKIGDKKKIINLSLKNAQLYKIQNLKKIKVINPRKYYDLIIKEMKKILFLYSEPRYIECFDNSNLQGSYSVSVCIVFRDGQPSKSEYRVFNIKNINNHNDCLSMEEVIFRRYSNLIKNKKELPHLIIVDGGKGQLSSAYKILCNLNIEYKTSIISIAKKLEKIYFPNNNIPLCLDKSSEVLKIIQYARDEAHRFSLYNHKKLRSNNFLSSKLDNIPGLGHKIINILLQNFKSIHKIKNASKIKIEEIIGKKKTNLLFDFLNKKNV